MPPQAGGSGSRRNHRVLALGAAVTAAAVMALWGFSELTAPFPHTMSKGCNPADEVVTKTISRAEVTISVYNAGAARGTARRFGSSLSHLGFKISDVANAPDGVRVTTAEVAGPSVTDPATKLVAEALGHEVTITADPALQIGPGVNVFIGPHHGKVVKTAPETIALPTPVVTCLTS